MKTLFSLVFLLSFTGALPPLPDAAVYSDNPDVGIEASLLPDSARSGDTVELLLLFSPGRAIHIPAKPLMVFTLDSSVSASLAGPPVRSIDQTTGFLSNGSPVRQAIRLLPGTGPGLRILRGTVSYYYCSDSDGWCRKFRQPVELSLVLTE